MKEGDYTIWGKVQHVKERAPGIFEVSTSSHGGFKLDRARNARVAAAWRREGGWYEEDIDWAIVLFTFPELFESEDQRASVISTLKNWLPDSYTEVTGQAVALEESFYLRERVI